MIDGSFLSKKQIKQYIGIDFFCIKRIYQNKKWLTYISNMNATPYRINKDVFYELLRLKVISLKEECFQMKVYKADRVRIKELVNDNN